jgi:hypothetical protein
LEQSNTRTEIIYGTQNIIKRTLQRVSATVKKIDVCISSAAVEGTVKAGPSFKETPRLKKIGIKIRDISETTKHNLPYCKTLMLTAEFRHTDGIRGIFQWLME